MNLRDEFARLMKEYIEYRKVHGVNAIPDQALIENAFYLAEVDVGIRKKPPQGHVFNQQ